VHVGYPFFIPKAERVIKGGNSTSVKDRGRRTTGTNRHRPGDDRDRIPIRRVCALSCLSKVQGVFTLLEASMRVMRVKEVVRLTGLSRSTIQRLERAGGFPRRRALSPGAVGWLEDDVVAWLRDRPTSDDRAAVA
jgi:prophage regulatory protein